MLVALLPLAASSAQTNAARTGISVLTCGPGTELYSLFGHTAIRIVDSVAHTDIVYNWGGFTFDQPNFYLKFLRGKLLYYSSADYFSDFMNVYAYEQRNVYEQVLNIDSAAKERIISAINFNMQGDNRYYKYDFLLDNCTTRVKNMVFGSVNSSLTQPVVPAHTSARDLIHYYLERGGQHWTGVGMDILMGSRVDRPLSADEAMFMPEFYMKGLASAATPNGLLARPTVTLFSAEATPAGTGKYFPLLLLSIFCGAVFLISRLTAAWAKILVSIIDSTLLYTTGLIGLVILFMWFGTDHTVCKNNINIAWALPFNLVAAFSLVRKPRWLSNYFLLTAVITAILLAAWFWLPQQLNIALLPVVVLQLNRYATLCRKYRSTV